MEIFNEHIFCPKFENIIYRIVQLQFSIVIDNYDNNK